MNPSEVPVTGEWQELKVGEGLVRYFEVGAGQPLVLIHGLSGSVRWWERNLEFLAQTFRVYALDLLEYGEGSARLQFALRKAPQRIAEWMRACGLQRASVIGHSMGGAIAAELAADYPELVQRLILANAAAAFLRSWLPLSPDAFVRNAPHFPQDLIPLLIQDAVRTGPRVLFRATKDLLMSDLRAKLPLIQAPTLVIWGIYD
ncbi:MAG TPA: alpha/beta hydrolase, partial [Chthoniobacteraceae bacterium]|nr:alpha/beta hydrolase [Chthoniobacteraceae bacterium]